MTADYADDSDGEKGEEFERLLIRAIRGLTSAFPAQFLDCAEVMLVVFGDEEAEIDDGHGLLEAGMERRAG